MENNTFLWYRDKDKLHLGDARRYNVTYLSKDKNRKELFLRLKNIERLPIRAIHLLNGPFIVYCHVVPYAYDQNKEFKLDNSNNLKEVRFENQIKPGQSFNVTLFLNSNSFKEYSDDGYPIYSWSIDIISQIYINKKTSVHYDLMIGCDIEEMKNLNRGPIQNTFLSLNKDLAMNLKESNTDLGEAKIDELTVTKKTTDDLWPLEPKYPDKPIHLVILTHGIFSNLTADMLYIKDSLNSGSNENLLITGYNGNSGKSEKGVKKLGIGCSNFIVFAIEEISKKYKIEKISFVGHSLGGLVQLFAIKNILQTKGTDYFSSRNITPENLVCLASPLLGVLSEFNFLISLFLDMGSLGKTGRDLTLSRKFPNLKGVARREISRKRDSLKPLLETLPDDPLQDFLGQFNKLTLYANAVNDGIVPLRTSALLYLDYEALGSVDAIKKKQIIPKQPKSDAQSIKTTESIETVGEISGNEENNTLNDAPNLPNDYIDFMSLNLNTKNKDLAVDSLGSKENKKEKISPTSSKPIDPEEKTKNDPIPKVISSSSIKPDTQKIDFTNFTERYSRRKKINRLRKMKRINAKGTRLGQLSSIASDTYTSDVEEDFDATDDDSESIRSVKLPPKASSIESAIYTILCPVPKNDFIIKPASRDPVIFHDRYYHFYNLPFASKNKPDQKVTSFGSVIFRNNEWKLNKQVKIAKKYHSPKMNWRKVLVNLPPDAHNNIIVRRRFANAYGWGVIDHLCNEVFFKHEDVKDEDEEDPLPSCNLQFNDEKNIKRHTKLKSKI